MSSFEAAKHQNATHSECPGETGAEAALQRQAAEEFSRALRRAHKAVAWGEPELAVEWCRYAALLAWGANPGFFYSHELEQLLAEIGRKYLHSGPVGAPRAGPPQRFLHVMTTVFETGGPTRVASRWIETCARYAPYEHHSVLITMQRGQPFPAWFQNSVRRTGGEIIELPSGLSRLQLAAEIRSRSLEYDAVILHIHPDDPLPNIAFYDQPRPALLFRHSDHLFNLGLEIVRVFADVRPVGCEMSIRFCPEAPRKVMLPLPLLDEPLACCSKVEARRKLGLLADGLVALTIGSPHKFIPVDGYSFATVVRSLCEANSQVRIVAVGPSESAPFPGLGQSVGGRFLTVGLVRDRETLELYYRAADIYLDAYPSSSGTAILDAARYGLPLLRFYNPYRCIVWCDDPGLDSVCQAVSTEDAFIATALEWLGWPEEKRQELGSRFRDAALRDHCGASWKSKWLDPAVNALALSENTHLDSMQISPQRKQLGFPGIGITTPPNDWPAGMFVAGTINSDAFFPSPIRVTGVLHSIKPLFFHPPGDGTAWRRFSMFAKLVAGCVPDHPIRTAPRRIWLVISGMVRRRRQLAG